MDHMYGAHEMPFTNKYVHLGHTEKTRIPQLIIPHVGHMTEALDRLCGAHDVDYVLRILDNICEGLDNAE